MKRLLHVSTFRHKKDNRPNNGAIYFEDLCERFKTFRISEIKEGPLWSPTKYHKNSTRAIGNVISVSCMVVDVDSVASFDAIDPLLQDYSWIVHSTYSHTPEHPKYRIIYPLSDDLPAGKYLEAWKRIQLWFCLRGVKIDAACKDASRVFYQPTARPGAERFSIACDWLPFLDIDKLPKPVIPEQIVFNTPTAHALNPPVEQIFSLALKRYKNSSRHDANIWMASQMRDNRIPLADALAVGPRFIQATQGDHPYTLQEYERCTRDMYNKPVRKAWSRVSAQSLEEMLLDA